jgi:hypothetical protein
MDVTDPYGQHDSSGVMLVICMHRWGHPHPLLICWLADFTDLQPMHGRNGTEPKLTDIASPF